MRKKTLILTFLSLCCILIATSSNAITIGIEPASMNVVEGDHFFVDLTFSGLEPPGFGSLSLSTFDIDISFNNTLLDFESVTFGDPFLGDQVDFETNFFGPAIKVDQLLPALDPNTSILNLFELSGDDPWTLEDMQAAEFTSARIGYTATGVGTSQLDLFVNVLGDAYGDSLSSYDLVDGSIEVAAAPVPEPATILLLASGMAGLGVIGRKKRMKS